MEIIKRHLIFFVAVAGFLILSFSANAASYEDAIRARNEGNIAKSEEEFVALIKKDPNNSELWFQLGLTQRFQKKLNEAEISQRKSLKIFSQNNDAKLEIARIYFWNGNYKQAEILLNEILVKQPRYLDAKELLISVKKSQLISEEKKPQWQMDIGHQQSSFSRVKLDSWSIDYLQIGRWVGADTLVNIRSENVKRFKQHDQYYEAGVVHNFSNRLNGKISAGRSPNADFYPRSRINVGLEAKLIHQHKFIGDAWLTGDVQYNRYQQFNITASKLGVRYSILEDLTVHLQYVDIMNEYNKHLKGWVGRTDWQTPLPQLRIFLGLANAPETQNAATIDTKSRFGGLAYQLTPNLTAYLSYSRDDRENSFIRKTVDGTLSLKF